jgi:NADH-quinone oxidoreductase subunit G
MIISVCVGSSCHLKGSYDVIELFKTALANNNLADKVTLKATFCLGKCGVAGVTVKIDNEIITGVTTENFDEIFKSNVLAKM